MITGRYRTGIRGDERQTIPLVSSDIKMTSLDSSNVFVNFVIRIVSDCLSFLFLIILTQFALITYFIKIHIKKECKYENPANSAYPVKPVKRTDLRYYAQLLGLEMYTFKLTTKDGFVIVLKHLVDPNRHYDGNSKPVLFIHGLLQSSGAFFTAGRKSLAYQMLQNGYDIWLGNNRCGFNPQHTEYKPSDPRMWNWDLTEMYKYDLTCMIDQVLKITCYQGKIVLVGHSQGTAEITLLLADSRVSYDNRIDKCVLLSPAAFGGPMLNSKLFIKFMRWLPDSLFDIFFGVHSFIPIMISLRNVMYKTPMYGLTAYAMFSYLFDSDDYKWDRTLRDIHFLFAPIYQSSKLMKWWLKGRGFQNGKAIINGPDPWFRDTTPPILLVIGGQDTLVNGNLFYNHFLQHEPSMKDKVKKLIVPTYNHLDVLWADDVQDTVGTPMLSFLSE